MAGWEPREFTDYLYEGDRLVGSVTSREREFSTHDVDLLLASARLESGIGEYGENVAEAMSSDADPARADRPYRYVAVGPRTNWAVYEVERAKAKYMTKHPDGPVPGSRWSVRKELTAQQEPDAGHD